MAADGCEFCVIAQGNDPKTKILYQGGEGAGLQGAEQSALIEMKQMDDEVVVFRDIKPGAPHHYLAIPKCHIRDAKHLDSSHIQLVETLTRAGQQVLQEQGGDPATARMGVHWPPLVLVPHFHVHILAPVDQMGFMSRLLFRNDSYWFSSVEWLIERLQKMKKREEKTKESEEKN